MKKEKQPIYHAALYLRLSNQKLNEELGESDSIVNQEALLRSHLKSYPDIEIKQIFKDDGWTGVNFNRPGFQKMMQKIYDNEIDCVVVKDLSRLGRNHTETGKYITRVFPAFGVRFIAVNDHIDTVNSNSDADNFIIPFKDLLNDSYSRDISMKIRSARAVKNAEGDFGGGFYVYGYEINPDDKNHYVIDPEAADVVRKIYRWTFDGLGSTEIVRRLETMHIPSPSEHKRKKKLGSKYVPGDHKWNIYQIYRILRNDVYTGTLRLGKTTTPNYKVKKIIHKPEEEQYVFHDNHEAIIPKNEFDLMQDLLSRDCRVSTKNGSSYAQVYPLVGYVFCADCGGSMVVKTTYSKGRHYRYYVCGENKRDRKLCSTHTISYEKLTAIVLDALNIHLKTLVKMEEVFHDKDLKIVAQPEIEKLQIRIGKMLEEKYRLTEQVKHLLTDYKEGILLEEEYLELKADYEKQIAEIESDAADLELQKQNQVVAEQSNMAWIRKYRDIGVLKELSRRDVVTFIDRIEVKDADHVRISFRFGDEYKRVLRNLKKESENDLAEERQVAVNG